ncbi:Protein kinase superfamily protein [Prunus dulcis]|uniref:Protein kinase superfamily protein n=1 Tax=Prunus dulcis TaxID=3755 RepID=A0A4Y1RZ20_PRUDU|nr:Protein kinase superfamily protein [Prunus dulcis]
MTALARRPVMATTALAASLSLSFKTACMLRSTGSSKMTSKGKRARQGRALGDFGHLGQVVRKDVEFLKRGIGSGIQWANKAFRIPEVSKTLDDIVWLRNLEDPMRLHCQLLLGLNLPIQVWSKPLPEVYDPESVGDYFRCRPHVVAFRLLESQHCQYASYMRLLADAVGQSLSTRPDIIGAEISKALSELHDQIPPFPRDVAMKIIEEELGSPVESLFSYISGNRGCSIFWSGVYRGHTLDGFNVAIKVQRPNLRHIVVRDIYILRLGLGILQKIAKRKGDLRLYADELGKGLVGELDYTLEASNSSKFMEAHSSFPFMFVPKIFQQLSRKRVLTMEWIVGESPTDLLTVSAGSSIDNGSTYSERQRLDAKRRLLDLVKKGVEACLVQLLETGLLHADPHPGNLRYTSSGQIGFLDFGLLCQMEKKHQFAMLASIVHIVNGDWASLVNSLTEMDVIRPGTNIRRVTMDLEYELGEVEFRDGIPDVKFSRVVFNKKKEFQWQRLALFLKVGATRKGLHGMMASKADSSLGYLPLRDSGAVDVANLVLRLLPSKEGVVLRRLLMTADGASLVQAMVSKEAKFFRQQFCSVIADILYQWMFMAFGWGIATTRYSSDLRLASAHDNRDLEPSSRTPIYDYRTIFRDRRLKVIFSNVLNSARKNPILMLRFYWTSFVMFTTALALACHRALVSFSEAYLSPISFARKQYAIHDAHIQL